MIRLRFWCLFFFFFFLLFGAYGSRKVFDDGRRVVGFRVNVERLVIQFSIWVILCGGKV